MSAETIEWLNQNCIVGFTDEIGTPWWLNEAASDGFVNTYPQAIPYERALEHFGFEFQERAIFVARADGTRDNARELPGRKAIVHPTTGAVTGIFKDGYTVHQYRPWLVDEVSQVLDIGRGELPLQSLLLLKSAAVAVASVRVPELLNTPEGVEFYTSLFGTTSVDGSLSTTYGAAVQEPICDNTTAVAIAQAGLAGRMIKIKHTKGSTVRKAEVRNALQIAEQLGDEFSRQVAALCRVPISPADWQKILEAATPLPPGASKRAQTYASNRQADLHQLYAHDPRCAPWQGTAWGAFQTFNTYGQHVQTVRDHSDRGDAAMAARVERNALATITGKTAQADADALALISGVVGYDLAALV